MSYDVSNQIYTGKDFTDIGESFNYTWNCGAMFREATGMSFSDLNGLKSTDASPIIRKAISALQTEVEKYNAMNPKNGWGDRETFAGWLDRIAIQCEEHPDSVLRIS